MEGARVRVSAFHYAVSALVWELTSGQGRGLSRAYMDYCNTLTSLEYKYLQGGGYLRDEEAIDYFARIVEPLGNPDFPTHWTREILVCIKDVYTNLVPACSRALGLVITSVLFKNLVQMSSRSLERLFPNMDVFQALMDLIEAMSNFSIKNKAASFRERLKLVDLTIVFCSKFAYKPKRRPEDIESSLKLQKACLLRILDFSDSRFCLYIVTQLLRAKRTPNCEKYLESIVINGEVPLGIIYNIKNPNIIRNNENGYTNTGQSNTPGTAVPGTTESSTLFGNEAQWQSSGTQLGTGDSSINPLVGIISTTNANANVNSNNSNNNVNSINGSDPEPMIVTSATATIGTTGTTRFGSIKRGDPRHSENATKVDLQVKPQNFCNILSEPIALNILDTFFDMEYQMVESYLWGLNEPPIYLSRSGGEIEILYETLANANFKSFSEKEFIRSSFSDDSQGPGSMKGKINKSNILNSNNNSTENDEKCFADDYAYYNLFDETLTAVLVNLVMQNAKTDIVGTMNIIFRMSLHKIFEKYIPFFLYNILSLLVVLFGTEEIEYTKGNPGEQKKRIIDFANYPICCIKWDNLWSMDSKQRNKLKTTMLSFLRSFVLDPRIFKVLLKNSCKFQLSCTPLNAVVQLLSHIIVGNNYYIQSSGNAVTSSNSSPIATINALEANNTFNQTASNSMTANSAQISVVSNPAAMQSASITSNTTSTGNMMGTNAIESSHGEAIGSAAVDSNNNIIGGSNNNNNINNNYSGGSSYNVLASNDSNTEMTEEKKRENLMALDIILLIISRENVSSNAPNFDDLFQYRKMVNTKIILQNLSSKLNVKKPTIGGITSIIKQHLEELYLIGLIPKPNPVLSDAVIAKIFLALPISPALRYTVLAGMKKENKEEYLGVLREALRIIIRKDIRSFWKYDFEAKFINEIFRRLFRFFAFHGESDLQEPFLKTANEVIYEEIGLGTRETNDSEGVNTLGEVHEGAALETNGLGSSHSNIFYSKNLSPELPFFYMKSFIKKMNDLSTTRKLHGNNDVTTLLQMIIMFHTTITNKNGAISKDLSFDNKDAFAEFTKGFSEVNINIDRPSSDNIYDCYVEEEIRPTLDISTAFPQEEFFYDNELIVRKVSRKLRRSVPSNENMILGISELPFCSFAISGTTFELGTYSEQLLNEVFNEVCNIPEIVDTHDDTVSINSLGQHFTNYLSFPISNPTYVFNNSILKILSKTAMSIICGITRSDSQNLVLKPIELRIKATQILTRITMCNDKFGIAAANELLNEVLCIVNKIRNSNYINVNQVLFIRDHLTITGVIVSVIKKISKELATNVLLTYILLENSGKRIDLSNNDSLTSHFICNESSSGIKSPVDEYITLCSKDKVSTNILASLWGRKNQQEQKSFCKILAFNIHKKSYPSAKTNTSGEATSRENVYNGKVNMIYSEDLQKYFYFEDKNPVLSMGTVSTIISNYYTPYTASILFVSIIKRLYDSSGTKGEFLLTTVIINELKRIIDDSQSQRKELESTPPTNTSVGRTGKNGNGFCNGNSGLVENQELVRDSTSVVNTTDSRALEIGPSSATILESQISDRSVKNANMNNNINSGRRLNKNGWVTKENIKVTKSNELLGIMKCRPADIQIENSEFIISTLRFIGLISICLAMSNKGDSYVPAADTCLCNKNSSDAHEPETKDMDQALSITASMSENARMLSESLLELTSHETNTGKDFAKVLMSKEFIYSAQRDSISYNKGDNIVPFVLRIALILAGGASRWMLRMRNKFGLELGSIKSPTQGYMGLIRELIQKYSPPASASSPTSIMNENIGETQFVSGIGIAQPGMSAATTALSESTTSRNNKNDGTIIDIRCDPLFKEVLQIVLWESGEVWVTCIDEREESLADIVQRNRINLDNIKDALSVMKLIVTSRTEWNEALLARRLTIERVRMLRGISLSPEAFILSMPKIGVIDKNILALVFGLSQGVTFGIPREKPIDISSIKLKGDSSSRIDKSIIAYALQSPGIDEDDIKILRNFWTERESTENICEPSSQMFNVQPSCSFLRSNKYPVSTGKEQANSKYLVALDKLEEVWPFKYSGRNTIDSSTSEALISIPVCVPNYVLAPLIIIARYIVGVIVMEREGKTMLMRESDVAKTIKDIIQPFIIHLLSTTHEARCSRGVFLLQQILIPAIAMGANSEIINMAKTCYNSVISSIGVLNGEARAKSSLSENNSRFDAKTNSSTIVISGNAIDIELIQSLLGWQLVDALFSWSAHRNEDPIKFGTSLSAVAIVGCIKDWIEYPKLCEALSEFLEYITDN